ncbi:DUF692 domain-containing protein [Ferrovibrio sp.]|uniref:MNIO family bufferin maturase n=1 Tax=Ferrovibrio sp. TaxID=1917215 RepID=UPI003D144562
MLVDRSQIRPLVRPRSALPCRAGVGLKPEHYAAILEQKPEAAPDVGWFELHPENYLGAGGPPHYYLERIRDRFPLSFHGVGLSIGGAGPLDRTHLTELRGLIERYQPAQFSEHLAWSSHGGAFLNDLLPLPYTRETLDLVADHVDQVQQALGRRMLIENPSTYLGFTGNTMDEVDFLAQLSLRSGCGLLLDVNNVYVSAVNNGFSAEAYIDRFPLSLVGEIHLAGHAESDDGALLIDSHDCAVLPPVWRLYERVLRRGGVFPTLIEWDGAIPDWRILLAEARRADTLLDPQRYALAEAS